MVNEIRCGIDGCAQGLRHHLPAAVWYFLGWRRGVGAENDITHDDTSFSGAIDMSSTDLDQRLFSLRLPGIDRATRDNHHQARSRGLIREKTNTW